MAARISVHLPEEVWEALVDFEPYPRPAALALAVRRKLRAATRVEIRQPGGRERVVRLTPRQGDQLLVWLRAVSLRADAPRDASRAAIIAVTTARRRSE